MTLHGNGEPLFFDVRLTGLAKDQLREMHHREADAGRGQQLVSAFRQIVRRLQHEPLAFGDPLYRLPALRTVVCQGTVYPLIVDYAVHEDHPLVFTSRIPPPFLISPSLLLIRQRPSFPFSICSWQAYNHLLKPRPRRSVCPARTFPDALGKGVRLMQRHVRLIVAGTLALIAAVAVALSVRSQPGQQSLQHGFEGRDPIWLPGGFDVAYKEISHSLTTETAHTGQKSELIQLQVEKPGSFIYYTYPIGKAPIADELNVSLWVKANRPGMQILCRVVLPRERDPQKPDQPLTTMLEGETYNRAGRWEQLVVRQPVKRLREKQAMLNGVLKHPVLTDDAYVDRVFLNVYGGPGETTVFTDDLEVGPLLNGPTAEPDTTTPGKVPAVPAVNRRTNEVLLKDNKLLVNGDRLFMRGIRHTGTPLKTLRKTGFNVVFLDETTPPGLIEDAANLGFWIIPSLSPPVVADARGGSVSGQLTSASSDAVSRQMAPFSPTPAPCLPGMSPRMSKAKTIRWCPSPKNRTAI